MKKISELVLKLKPIEADANPTKDRRLVAYTPCIKIGESKLIKFAGRKNIEYTACTCRRCNKWWNISINMKIMEIGYICPVCSSKC